MKLSTALNRENRGVAATVLVILILLPLGVGSHILRRHQTGVMAKRCEPARKMMRSNACLHADQARRQIGEPHTDLTARPFLAQHDRTTLILADNMERVLADIDADHGNLGDGFAGFR